MSFRYVSPENQQAANLYWASRERKKWVCEFWVDRKPKKLETVCYVSARTKVGALNTGKLQATMFGNTWVNRARSRVRLATALDLGCVVTGEQP